MPPVILEGEPAHTEYRYVFPEIVVRTVVFDGRDVLINSGIPEDAAPNDIVIRSVSKHRNIGMS